MLKNVKGPRGDIGPAGVSPWPRPPPQKSPPGPAYILLWLCHPPPAAGFSGCPTVAGLGFGEAALDGPFGEAEAGGDPGRERVTGGTEAAVYSRWQSLRTTLPLLASGGAADETAAD